MPDNPPPAGERLEPGRLREALIGEWKNPLLSVRLHEDGTLTATTAAGADQAGRWSVDPAGRVRADLMGGAVVVDASIAGDELALVINGRTLLL